MNLKLVNRFRQPKHTGENRCEPCTVLNLLIATVGSASIARRSRVAGIVAASISIVLIYLRGYLIPRTPTLTKRYLPSALLRWFGKNPTSLQTASGLASESAEFDRVEQNHEVSQTDVSDSRAADYDLELYYIQNDVLKPCERGDDLCITDEFETKWIDSMTALSEHDVSANEMISAFGLGKHSYEPKVDSHDEAWVLYGDGKPLGQWPSWTALLADLSAAQLLEKADEGWTAHSPEMKGQILTGLRLFLNQCPKNGGRVEFEQHTVESCCQSQEVLAAVCSESGERVFEQPAKDLA